MSEKSIPTLNELADSYIQLAKELHDFIGQFSDVHCAACKTPCCNTDHCSSLAESAWLKYVATRAGAVLPEEPPYDFLGPTGCTLVAGRPIVCTAYICDQLALKIRDPLERFAYQVASDALPHVARGLTRTMDLSDVENLERLTDAQLRRVGKRVAEAHDGLVRARTVLESRKENASVEDTATAIIRIARTFPYAARQARFDDELPTLSQAARKRLAAEAE